jgi:hypothetical protein
MTRGRTTVRSDALLEGPLAGTLAAVDAADEWVGWRLAPGGAADDWVRCADVDAAFVTAWEQAAASTQVAEHGRSDPRAAAAYVLGWYAELPGMVGGRLFAVARRVPRLDGGSLAFRQHPTEFWPDHVALLDARFWCLPDDPATDHPCASVVGDENELAILLRQQVRAHADEFLGWYRPGARLARRNLLGAFFDGLDGGVWQGRDPGPTGRAQLRATASCVLPGGTPEFAEASTLYELTDDRGSTHLTRERISCCHYYTLDEESPCFTCPRTTPRSRAQRAAEWEESP